MHHHIPPQLPSKIPFEFFPFLSLFPLFVFPFHLPSANISYLRTIGLFVFPRECMEYQYWYMC